MKLEDIDRVFTDLANKMYAGQLVVSSEENFLLGIVMGSAAWAKDKGGTLEAFRNRILEKRADGVLVQFDVLERMIQAMEGPEEELGILAVDPHICVRAMASLRLQGENA
jgi:hypothetical protein